MDPRYPIGKLKFDLHVTPEKRAAWIGQIGSLPAEFRAAVAALPPGGLDRPYREGGWTARQVVHHLADSHINAYVRVRLALTEDNPPAKAYAEALWAELVDARTADPAVSLTLLDALHHRWHLLWLSLVPEQFARTAQHSESGTITIDRFLQMYAWHGRHHTGHLNLLIA